MHVTLLSGPRLLGQGACKLLCTGVRTSVGVQVAGEQLALFPRSTQTDALHVPIGPLVADPHASQDAELATAGDASQLGIQFWTCNHSANGVTLDEVDWEGKPRRRLRSR